MAKQTINLGTGELTGDGESIRSALIKVNENFTEVYADIAAVAAVGAFSGNYDDLTNKPNLTNRDLQGSVYADDSTLLVDGVNSKINLQNTVLNDTISTSDENFLINTAATPGDRGFTNITTTDNILDIQGAAALPGGQGGGIYINGGIPFDDPSDYTRYGDIIISGRIVSILAGDGEGGGGLTIAGPVIGTTAMDIKGSVFGDDSTVLVDGVAGKIVGPVDTASITQSDTGSFTSNFTTTITQDNQYTKFTKVDVFDDGDFVNTINREIKLGANSLLFDSTVGATAVIRNDSIGGSLTLEAGTGNAGEGDADGGDIVITSGYAGVGGDGGNIILNSNADIFVGPLANTLDIRIGGGPGYAGENNTFFYGNVNIDSGKKLDTESVTNSSGNLTLSADNYVIIDSDNNGQINIGVESGIGNVLLGNIDNGTDVIVNGRLFHGGGIAPASSIGASGDFKGEVVFDDSYIYYCTETYDGVTNIWKRVAWSADTW